jgi:arsenical pump membrane protein
VAFVLVGFTLGDVLGVPAWLVAAGAAAWASASARHLPWRDVPVGAVATAAALGILVAGAAPHLPLERALDGAGAAGVLRGVAAATVLSNAANNLPTVLAGVEVTDRSSVWPLLVGANIGAVFLVTGSLSTLLWRDTARRQGVDVDARGWSRVAVRVGAPALAVATLALLLP